MVGDLQDVIIAADAARNLGARPHTRRPPTRRKIPAVKHINQIFPSHPIVERPGLPISRQRRSKIMYS
jgi:hypothetical protein